MSASLTAALSRVSLDDHEEVLKIAESTLKKTPSDITAQHVKVVALLKLDRYSDVIRLVKDARPELKEKVWFEYGYALYRSEKPEEAVAILEAHGGERGINHLLAQAVSS